MPTTRTETISLHDGEMGAHLAVPDLGTGPGVLVIQEIGGVNQYMRDVAERLAALGYVALVPDVFWRVQPGFAVDTFNDATMPQALGVASKVDADACLADLGVALEALRELPEVVGGVGVLGFCFGGTQAFLVAAEYEPDVAVSYYHFYRSHLGFRGDFDAFFERFLQGDLQYGSWFRHVADWQRVAARANVCVLSYEALQRDPESGVRAIAGLCGVTLSPQRTAEILDCASFAAMKRHEDKFDHALSEPDSSAPRGAFVRKGRVGGHREHLSAAQLARFEEARAQQAPRRLPELRLAAFLH